MVKQQVPQILDLVGLTKKADNLPNELSGGEQQRVSIARAFANRPLILLADEPTGNLDPANSAGIMRLLDRINRTGTTVVMCTHDYGIVDLMRRRVVELNRGVLVRDEAQGAYATGPLPVVESPGGPGEPRLMALHLGYVTRETAVSLKRNLLMTLAGILTVAVSLFLFGGVLLLSRMVDHGTARWKNGVELEIFLCSKSTAEPDSPKPTCRSEASEGQIAAVRAELEQSPDVRRFRFFSKEDAFNEAKRIFAGDPELLSNIDPDGLPVSFRVAPKKAELTEKVAAHFQSRFNDGIDTVLTAKEQVRRLLAGIRWIRGLFFAIAGVLLASSLFLIVNTIRLATFARRREIQVMKLVGATNWFIRVPFMCEGLIQGAIGAGLAFGGVYALRVILSDLVDRSKNLFSAFYVTGGDAVAIGLLIVAVGATVGAMGSAIGLRRFLDA